MSNSTQQTGNQNEPKKSKRGRPVSRVLHIRQLPDEATEDDVISLVRPFGKVTNLVMMKGKSQALLEMATEEAATNMVDSYASVPPVLHSHPVYFQFSNYTELKFIDTPHQIEAQGALQAANPRESGNLSDTGARGAEAACAPIYGPVLRIMIDNVFYPVTLEVLHQIFSRYGNVLKIVMFTKNNNLQVLLQYDDPVNAFHAKMCLDGHSIYNACCTLRIDFSRLANLTVRYNNEKSRDFTRIDLPSGYRRRHLQPQPCIAPNLGTQHSPFPFYQGATGFTPVMGFPQASGTTSPVSGQIAIPCDTGVRGTTVLLVSNLNTEAITTYGLFILFGLYGDVHRVKIMYTRKENALIQMANRRQACLAIRYLNGQILYGRIISTTFSKYQSVRLLHRGQRDYGLTKDYSRSHLCRFKRRVSRNFQSVVPPSDTLYLSNIPLSTTAADLEKLFSDTGSTVKAFKFFPRDCRMALIQLASVEEAIHALIKCQYHDFGQNHHLRISFSKCRI
ncbi:polypyrimidine tract-binding protein 3 [Tyto alba]|uniref:polypyrimidine tract-binding protein 3 n=1 Tax=Tyto alba TaxID=56313 RepID=UPI001C6695C7|nr:polypyrimidine tract-binding protein 3 [Tyto alba]